MAEEPKITSAGTYMQITQLCRSCSRQNFCGNGMTDYYCTGHTPIVQTDIITPPFTDLQKKVIEATETIIAEQGKVCDVDDDLDEDVQTNEEYIRSCSTEELAEWIFNDRQEQSDWWYGQRGNTIKDIMEWLQEKHI